MSTRILIVEDESLIALDLQRRLSVIGYPSSRVVASGAEALAALEQAQPDLILMDIRLEGPMDGIEAAQQIRERYRLPVVFLTSHTDEDTIQRAKRTTAFGYLAKPFAERELHATIQFALHQSMLERELEEQRAWLDAVLRSIADGVVATNAAGHVRFMNRAAERITGADAAASLGMPVTQVVDLRPDEGLESPPEHPATQLLNDTALTDVQSQAWHCASPDGGQVPVEVHVTRIHAPEGEASGAVVAIRDISARKTAEEVLHRLAAVVQSSEDAIIGLDPEGRITSWNPGAERLCGYSAAQAIGQPVSLFFPLSAYQDFRMIEEVRTGVSVRSHETTLRRSGGEEVAVSLSAAPIRDGSGQVAGLSCTIRDISRRKKAEEEVRRMNETLHQLSSELLRLQDHERRRIARDLHDSTGQILAGLAMMLSQIESDTLPPDKRRHIVAECMELTQQCSREVRSVSYLLHPPLLDELGLASALRAFVDGFARRTGVDVAIGIPNEFGRLDRELETAIFRIVQEALTNVHRHSGSADAQIRLRRTESHVELEVMDHGRGLHAADGVSRGEGSPGVGILGIRERARQLNGSVTIFDHGGGVTVKAVFPLNPCAGG